MISRLHQTSLFIKSSCFHLVFWSWITCLMVCFIPLLIIPGKYLVWTQKVWSQTICFLLRTIVGVHVYIEGLQHLPAESCIIAARHESVFDTIIYVNILNNPAMVLKKELQYIPVYGQMVMKFPMIVVDRKARSLALRRLLRDAKQIASKNRHIVLFPEGTRVPPGDQVDLQPGVAFLAQQLNLPVVPVATNSGSYWPKRSFLKNPGTIILKFLPPISCREPPPCFSQKTINHFS